MLGKFLSESPFSVFDLDIERDKDFGREIDLSTEKNRIDETSAE